ncbi:MAG: hypothetical protein OXL37_03235 [Chloroflexota bacterium]|nr:hypothetical protein [Chloroflexota bacterium]MDE2962000.1 hypothetical protein [Chloroflexota bacterium]
MQTLTRKSLKLKACPRCGGDVCRMRDTFGVYHQCAQCGREIRRVASSPVPTTTIAAMNMPSNPTNHREKVTA